MVRERIASDDGRERQQYFDLVMIDRSQQPIQQPADSVAKKQTAACFPQQFHQSGLQGRGCAARRKRQKQGKQYDAHAVIEERLSGDHDLEAPGRSRRSHNAHHRNRIRG